ncbi:ABC transporter ATP-binding protein [Bacteroides caecigallinarum]|uniref:ABC transporter ATP-binding protein n=1 Tax=Bacteroides caecigallinarum TaxID=1411144 RepID=UPI001F16288D|nr:ABC transporter ATP-binding protein [Bacteroides caecigallinarum]MCF2551426.1 ABC transporter ATP-binding protein [Bacteroides caecigallinarum]
MDRKILGSAIATASWMYRQTSGYRIPVSASVLLGVIRIAASLSFIWISKEMIDMAVRSDGNLTKYALLLVSALVAEILCSVVQGYINVRAEAGIRNSLRSRVFARALNARWNGKERWHTGDVVNRLEEDVRVIADTLCHLVPGALVTMVQLVAAFVFLWTMNPMLAWVILCILPVFMILAATMARRIKKLTTDIRKSDSQVQSVLQESLQRRIVIMALGRVEYVMNRLVTAQDSLMEKVMKRNKFSMSSRAAIMAGFATGYLTAFIWGVHRMQDGIITFGMLSAFLQLVGQIQRPTADMSRRLPTLIHSMASADRLIELYNSEQEESSVCGCNVHGSWNGIRFENVTFAYPDSDRKILDNFCHDFSSGTSTAIMGETGAGKSTMMRLMLGLLKPESGNVVLYNEFGETTCPSPSSRADIVYVPQGNSLLSATIRENLIGGNKAISEEDIKKALYMAAAEFVYELPDGLETLCGEGGEGLSEGQAQRIAIARALLNKGRIMLLDEFTSALDAETEHRLMERLIKNNYDKTLVFITHRSEIAERCDNIVSLYRKKKSDEKAGNA